MKILIPSDFAEEVERLSGSPFNEEQARAVLQALLTHAAGRLLMAHALLPHFMMYIETENKAATREAFSGPRLVVCFAGMPSPEKVPL